MSFVTLISYDIPSVSVLVDFGSSDCFIDTTFINEHAISSYPDPPLQLQLFNGTTNSTITQAINLSVRFQTSDITLMTFYICHSTRWLLFSCSRTQLAHLLQSVDWLGFGQYLIPLVWTEHLSTPELISTASGFTPFSYSYTIRYTTEFLPMQGSAHYDYQCPCFCISLSSWELHPIQPANPTSGEWSPLRFYYSKSKSSELSGVPPDYHDFADVFSKSKADMLAPHHEHDLKIDLEEGASPPIGTTYSLSPSKLESLWTFLDEHLTMGFIRPSSSAHAALVLFVRCRDWYVSVGVSSISPTFRMPFHSKYPTQRILVKSEPSCLSLKVLLYSGASVVLVFYIGTIC